jgi:hypothetical protein
MKKLVIICIALLTALQAFAENAKSVRKEIAATRLETAPVVDGKLDDQVWTTVPLASGFTQEKPNAGKSSVLKSEIRVVYDDEALYIGAMLYDKAEHISKTLTQRDELGNADVFGVVIDPYKSGLNGYGFLATAAGVQYDMTINHNANDNVNWDAVWESKVQILENGWSIELKIPYSALRFANTPIQSWYVNFARLSNKTGEMSWWNEVDRSKNGFFTQAGVLSNLKDIKPPVRLFAYPYLSAAVNRTGEGDVSSAYSGGMDLKYGINDAFTLDMTLIPDFGQVQSDNHVLNLGPFEVKYDENRQFFTEGTELFNKGDVFYSRRIGQSFGKAGQLNILSDEEYVSSPSDAPMINATKISGRTRKGLGVGFFNAMTNETYATVEDTLTKEQREIVYDPFTNFNVVVIDQNLKNNSNVSLINTNVTRWGNALDANVSRADFTLNNKSNTYKLTGRAALSTQFGRNQDQIAESETGYSYSLQLRKSSGKWQFSLWRGVESDTYNPNDMGYISNANELRHGFWLGYINNKPKSKLFNNINFDLEMGHTQLYKPRAYASLYGFLGSYGQFKNFWDYSISVNFNPIERHDYFEARVDGQKFVVPGNYNLNMWLMTDSRKPFSISGYAGTFRRPEWEQVDYWAGLTPRYNVSEKLRFSHSFGYNIEQDDKGFVDKLPNENEGGERIIFGIRDVQTFENTFSGSYTFNDKMGITLRLRHYWSKVPYTNQYFELDKEGFLHQVDDVQYLDENGNHKYNQNFNAFNIDMVYKWRFAPGSEISVVWKSAFSGLDEDVDHNFFSNLNSKVFTPDEEIGKHSMPLHHFNNMLSVKIMYFLDYNQVRKHF